MQFIFFFNTVRCCKIVIGISILYSHFRGDIDKDVFFFLSFLCSGCWICFIFLFWSNSVIVNCLMLRLGSSGNYSCGVANGNLLWWFLIFYKFSYLRLRCRNFLQLIWFSVGSVSQLGIQKTSSFLSNSHTTFSLAQGHKMIISSAVVISWT